MRLRLNLLNDEISGAAHNAKNIHADRHLGQQSIRQISPADFRVDGKCDFVDNFAAGDFTQGRTAISMWIK